MKGMLDPRILRAVDELEGRILETQSEHLTRTHSLVNVVKDTNEVMNDGDPAFYRVPETRQMVSQLLYLFNSANPEDRRALVSDDYSKAQVTLYIRNSSTNEYEGFFTDIGEEIEASFAHLRDDFPEMEINLTGSMALLWRMSDEISRSQVESFAIALAVISVMLIVALGSLQGGLVAMVPNLIPAFLGFGLMGTRRHSARRRHLARRAGHHRHRGGRHDPFHDALPRAIDQDRQHQRVPAPDHQPRGAGGDVHDHGAWARFHAAQFFRLSRHGENGIFRLAFDHHGAGLRPVPDSGDDHDFQADLRHPRRGHADPFPGEPRVTARALAMLALAAVWPALAQPEAEPAAGPAQFPDGREVMRQVEEFQRATSDSAFNRMQLSTCRFGVRENRITCAERPRVKALESVSKNYGPEGLDSRGVTIVLEPADERGIGLLSYVYDEADRQNESWIYLSALGRVKRIASGNSDEESESASVFGSEFTTEDMDTGKLDQYEINVLEESTEGGREVWVVELVPNEARARETRYGRVVNYIDKERYVALRTDLYDHYGNAVKRMLASRVELFDGAWVARSVTMMNLITNRLSNMAFIEIYTGIDVDDEVLTQRTLTDAAFRESQLQSIRSQVD